MYHQASLTSLIVLKHHILHLLLVVGLARLADLARRFIKLLVGEIMKVYFLLLFFLFLLPRLLLLPLDRLDHLLSAFAMELAYNLLRWARLRILVQ